MSLLKKKKNPPKRCPWRPDARCYKINQDTWRSCQQVEAKVAEDQAEEEQLFAM